MFAKALTFALLALSVVAQPHAARDSRRHHALAARRAAPEPVVPVQLPESIADKRVIRKKRASNSGRCRPRPTSSSVPVTVSISSTAVPSSSVAPVNVAPDPSTPSTSSAVATPPPATTSSTPEPAPTTSSTLPPATSSSKVAPSPTTSSSAPSSGEPSFMFGTQTGQATWYDTGLTACGITNTDSQSIAAVSHLLFDSFPGYNGVNPNNNPICGKQVIATYQGKSVTLTITDRCTACALTDLDLTPSAFGQLADLGVGRLSGMTWVWA